MTRKRKEQDNKEAKARKTTAKKSKEPKKESKKEDKKETKEQTEEKKVTVLAQTETDTTESGKSDTNQSEQKPKSKTTPRKRKGSAHRTLMHREMKSIAVNIREISNCIRALNMYNFTKSMERIGFLVGMVTGKQVPRLVSVADQDSDREAIDAMKNASSCLELIEKSGKDICKMPYWSDRIIASYKNKVHDWAEMHMKAINSISQDYYVESDHSDEDRLVDMEGVTVDVFVICWNEMEIMPFVVDYWKRFARYVYVYDNMSDDGTVEYLKQFDWITVIPYDSKGEIRDDIYIQLKDTVWKGSDADWVWVSDVDEVLYSERLGSKLKKEMRDGVTLITPNQIEAVSTTNIPEREDGKLLHELVDGGIIASVSSKIENVRYEGKTLLFRPGQIDSIGYTIGAHNCRPTGNVKFANGVVNKIHFKNLGLDYVMRRYDMYRKRMSRINRQKGWGYQYTMEREKHKEFFMEKMNAVRPISELLV